MRISETGSERTGRCRPAHAGFTLIELMVVLFIVGLVAIVVVLTFPETESGAEEDARFFASRLTLAAQESITTGDVVGVDISEQGYRFYRYRRGRWVGVQDDQLLGRGNWAARTKVFLERDGGAAVELAATAEGQAPVVAPDIQFEPVGFATPFTLALERGDSAFLVTGDATGRITYGRADDLR